MTTLFARSDLREVVLPRGVRYEVKRRGDAAVVEADPVDVPALLATGSLVERQIDVPRTHDEIAAEQRLEREGNIALQAAARHIAAVATETVVAEAAAAVRKPRRRN